MRINYFIEYDGRVFAYRSTGKLVALTQKTFGVMHHLVEVPAEERDTIRRKYSEVSYRQITDDRIPKWLKNKVKYFEGPFAYRFDLDHELKTMDKVTFDDVNDLCRRLLTIKREKMRKILVDKIVQSREFIESGNSWQLSSNVKEYHRGRIQALKEILETTD